MKHLCLSLASLLVIGCGTVVGNGKSGPDKPQNNDKANSQSPDASGGSVNNESPTESQAPAKTPEPATGAIVVDPLVGHFFVACASPFAIADESAYAGEEGLISVTVDEKIRYIVGAFAATVTAAPTTENPYAIAAISGSANVSCSNISEATVTGGKKVTVTYSDNVKVEWIVNADQLQSFKATSADASQTIEYTRAGDE